jgi:hypothetical protein
LLRALLTASVGSRFSSVALIARLLYGGLTGACGKAQDGTQACGRLPMHAQKQSNNGRLARGLRVEDAKDQQLVEGRWAKLRVRQLPGGELPC